MDITRPHVLDIFCQLGTRWLNVCFGIQDHQWCQELQRLIAFSHTQETVKHGCRNSETGRAELRTINLLKGWSRFWLQECIQNQIFVICDTIYM